MSQSGVQVRGGGRATPAKESLLQGRLCTRVEEGQRISTAAGTVTVLNYCGSHCICHIIINDFALISAVNRAVREPVLPAQLRVLGLLRHRQPSQPAKDFEVS